MTTRKTKRDPVDTYPRSYGSEHEKGYVRIVSENGSLPVEYQLHDGYPRGQARISDFINNASLLSIRGGDEGGFQE